MAQKCVHRGCEKVYTDPDEDCQYHPGPPVFHEGQKGEFWFRSATVTMSIGCALVHRLLMSVLNRLEVL